MPFKLKVNMLHALLSEQRDHFISRHPDCESSNPPASEGEVCALLRCSRATLLLVRCKRSDYGTGRDDATRHDDQQSPAPVRMLSHCDDATAIIDTGANTCRPSVRWKLLFC